MSRWNKSQTTGSRCILTLPLACNKPQREQLDKTFQMVNNIKNMTISWYNTQLHEMIRTRIWRENQQTLRALHEEYDPDLKALQALQNEAKNLKEGKTLSKTKQRKLNHLLVRKEEFQEKQQPLIEVRNAIIKKYKFSRSEFEKRASIYRKPYAAYVGSMVAQRAADDAWVMFESWLYGKGKRITHSKAGGFLTIEGKTNATNIVFDWDSMTVSLGQGSHKISVKVKRGHKNPYGYEEEALSRRVCYCRITRKAYPEGWRYFTQLVLEGPPPIKAKLETGELLHPMGKGRVGLDIGPQTLAYSANKAVGLVELAEGAQDLQKEIRRVNRAMDRSRRATNPGMYTPNGQIVRKSKLPPELRTRHGGRKWFKSNRYRELERYRRHLYRKQADLRRERHRQLANQLLAAGDEFYVEDMRWRALAKKSKKPKKNKKGKNLSRKRFGKSIANKSPGSFLSILEQKVKAQGGSFKRIITWKARASQYHHMTGKYKKKKLSQRTDVLEDGSRVQRDLYSAFLIQHANKALDGFNVRLCKKDYANFLRMHNEVMEALAHSDKRLPSSMLGQRKRSMWGVRQKAS